jgi:hypothetical protein
LTVPRTAGGEALQQWRRELERRLLELDGRVRRDLRGGPA